MKKRVLALIIAVFLIFGCCGCSNGKVTEEVESWVEGGSENIVSGEANGEGGSNNNGDSTGNGGSNTNTGSNSNITNPLSPNLKGATVTIYQAEDKIFSPNASNSKRDKAQADMIAKLQKELNCKFKVTTVSSSKLKSMVSASAASGKALCDIIVPQLYDVGYFVSANLCADMTRISSMDCSKDYMNRFGVLNASQILKSKYAVAACGHDTTQVTFFNKRILKEIGYDESYIYNLVDNGKWTWEEFRNLSKKAVKDLDGKPGKSSADQYGFTFQDFSSQTTIDILYSMGTSMIKLNSAGELTYNMTDTKVVDAITLGREIIKDGTVYWGDNYTNRINHFCDGKALFLNSTVVYSSTMANKMKDHYGLVPVPQVNASKKYTSAYEINNLVLIIPAGLTAKNQYNAGAVVQAYSYLYDNVLNAAKTEYLNRYFDDEKSGENWLLAQKYVTAHPELIYSRLDDNILAGTYRVFWDYVEGRSSSAISHIESTKAAAITSLNEINKKVKNRE